jgi:hypothetical protein
VLNLPDASEILPTMLRSKGVAIYSTVQSVTVTYNQYVNPIAIEAIGEFGVLDPGVYLTSKLGDTTFCLWQCRFSSSYTPGSVSKRPKVLRWKKSDTFSTVLMSSRKLGEMQGCERQAEGTRLPRQSTTRLRPEVKTPPAGLLREALSLL